MLARFNAEVAVGLFLVVGFLAFAYVSVRLGDVRLFGGHRYEVEARFGSISGLKEGAVVEIAGVQVGKVAAIALDGETYEARVRLALDDGVQLQADSIASIRTAGIIGERFVDIAPGGADAFLADGGVIVETESAINLEALVSKYIFEKKE